MQVKSSFLFIFSALLVSASSVFIFWLEPDNFKSVFNGFWWTVTTVTTVGYGDYYPETIAGKLWAVFLYFFGIGLITIVISKVVDSIFMLKQKKEEGKLSYRDEQHFVIIGWSKHAELAIQEIRASDPEADIVLIDQLEKTPTEDEHVHYVRGNPVQKKILDQANLSKARAVFIFSNDTTRFRQQLEDTSYIDGKTLLIATAIERNYDPIYTVVEIRDRANIDNFQHVKVDEFILSSEMVSQLAVRAAFSPGSINIMSQLISSRKGEDLYEIRSRKHWKTYRDAYIELLNEGANLIAEGENLDIMRRLDEPIANNARLFVICNKETYHKLSHSS